MRRKDSQIICKGFGTWHGWKHDRHWFACGHCRWSHVVTPVARVGKKYIPLDAETEENHKQYREAFVKELTS